MDRVVVFFGLRFTYGPEVEIETIEEIDARFSRARQHKLDEYSGRLTDGSEQFLLIGSKICVIGAMADLNAFVTKDRMDHLVAEGSQRLKAAGFNDTPAFHFQYEADF